MPNVHFILEIISSQCRPSAVKGRIGEFIFFPAVGEQWPADSEVIKSENRNRK